MYSRVSVPRFLLCLFLHSPYFQLPQNETSFLWGWVIRMNIEKPDQNGQGQGKDQTQEAALIYKIKSQRGGIWR